MPQPRKTRGHLMSDLFLSFIHRAIRKIIERDRLPDRNDKGAFLFDQPRIFRKRLPGPIDHDWKDLDLVVAREFESSHLERVDLPVRTSGSLGKKQDAHAPVENLDDPLNSFPAAFVTRAIHRNITRGRHAPSHERDPEKFTFCQELKIDRERGTDGENVQHALMVRNDNVMLSFLKVLAAAHGDAPDGAESDDRPCPPDRVLMNDPPRSPVKEKRQRKSDEDIQSRGKESQNDRPAPHDQGIKKFCLETERLLFVDLHKNGILTAKLPLGNSFLDTRSKVWL